MTLRRSVFFRALGILFLFVFVGAAWASSPNDPIQLFIKLGYHRLLGMSPETYRASIPPFPVHIRNRIPGFHLKVLVDPRIPLENQFRRGRIQAGGLNIRQFKDRPSRPYWLWVGLFPIPENKKARSTCTVGKSLSVRQGISLIVQYPNLLHQFDIGLSGSVYTTRERLDWVPYLSHYGSERPYISYALPFAKWEEYRIACGIPTEQ